MSCGGDDGEVGLWGRAGGGRCEGIEVAFAIATKHHTSGLDILDRKTKCVKLYRTVVVIKLTNKKLHISNETTRTLCKRKLDALVGRMELPR